MLRAAFLLTLLPLGFATSAEARQLVTLHTFCSEANCADGQFPQAGLVRDADGNLYGTASQGGAFGDGVVFALDKDGDGFAFKVLHSFCRSCGEGSFPGAGLIVDTQGNLYGTTETGGANDCGTVFKLSRRKLKTLHSFCATDDDGDLPAAGLSYQGQASGVVYDGTSPLYGTTTRGGARNFGTAFSLRLRHGTWKAKTLHSFCSLSQCADGTEPSGEVTLDPAGDLYGVTSLGGFGNGGVVYKISGVKTLHWDFCTSGCGSGQNPHGALLLDDSGKLFGTAPNTTFEQGVVYSVKDGSFALLHVFCVDFCSDGYAPTSGVVSDDKHTIYGTTSLGGTSQAGTIYQIDRIRGFSTIYNFCSEADCTDGRAPLTPLVLDPARDLFGTTSQGGAGSGTVFELKA